VVQQQESLGQTLFEVGVVAVGMVLLELEQKEKNRQRRALLLQQSRHTWQSEHLQAE